MCGLAGQMRFDGTAPEKAVLEDMLSGIIHRGPDDSGIVSEDGIGLVSSRLAIQDLSDSGHMPMQGAGGRYLIAFNGEIYNFRELRDELQAQGVSFRSEGDTEVVVELYARYGADMLPRLRGMFALAIWDRERKALFLARDRFGKKPLKYWSDHSRFIFASELKAVLADPAVKREVDWDAVDEFLAFRYVPAPRTGFSGIKKLPPASWMRVSADGGQEIVRWWQLSYEPKRLLTEREWMNEVDDLLKESVRLRLISDVPVGAHLSGGVDSSLIVAYASELSGTRLPTFSMGFSDPRYDERAFARLVAERYGTDHHEFTVEPQDVVQLVDELARSYEEPYADPSALPTWLLSRHTRQHVSVALNGDGGDELFGGYDRYRALLLHGFGMRSGISHLGPLASVAGDVMFRLGMRRTGHRMRFIGRNVRRTPEELFARMVTAFPDEERGALYAAAAQGRNSGSRASRLIADSWNAVPANDLLDHAYGVDIATSLADGLLPKVDIASMAHGLEMRSPLLDHVLAEHAMRMPAALKTTRRDGKVILKSLAREKLPAACLDRPKQGFAVPLDAWFAGDLQGYVRSELLAPAFLDAGFDEAAIRRLLDEHGSGKARHDARIWALLMLKRWFAAWKFL